MTPSILRSLPLAVALAVGSAGLTAQAQGSTPASPPAAAASKPANSEGVVEKTKQGAKKAAAGTKRVARKTADATKRGANRAASAVRNTGEKIGEKLPPRPADGRTDSQGQAKTAP